VWWRKPVTPAYRRLRWGDQEFKASLDYIKTLFPKTGEKKK
jgi:hypothetical protein